MSHKVFVRVAACLAASLATLGQVSAQTANPYAPPDGGSYGYQGQSTSPYSPPPTQSYGNTGYGSSGAGAPSYGSSGYGSQGGQAYAPQGGAYSPQGGSYGAPMNDAYVPPQSGSAYGSGQGYGYSANNANAYSSPPPGTTYSDPGTPVTGGSYGTPYTSAPENDQNGGYRANGPENDQKGYNQEEIITAGHSFFGTVNKNLASAVEYAFKSQGRPNGYVLGEDAGGAFVVGLRYGEGRLFTKDAGDHKVFWQGPSLGYDAGAEGSKTMILVYNLRDPSEMYNRFGGVQGSAYVIGGVSVQFQKYNDVTLGIIRSGVGLRLGANVGYLHYTRQPTWNPL